MIVYAACDLGDDALKVPRGTKGTVIQLIRGAMDVTFHLPTGETLTTTVTLAEVSAEDPSLS